MIERWMFLYVEAVSPSTRSHKFYTNSISGPSFYCQPRNSNSKILPFKMMETHKNAGLNWFAEWIHFRTCPCLVLLLVCPIWTPLLLSICFPRHAFGRRESRPDELIRKLLWPSAWDIGKLGKPIEQWQKPCYIPQNWLVNGEILIMARDISPL